MSDPFFGSTGGAPRGGVGGNPESSASITIDTRSVLEAVNTVKTASKAMEDYLKSLDSTIKTVEASLKAMANQAKISVLEARTAASNAAAEATKARTALAKTTGKNQISRQEHLQTMKDKSAEMSADQQAHQRYMQNSKVRQQTSKQNHQSVMANLKAQSQASSQLHQQQMAALRSTMQLSKQNHQVTLQNLKNQGQAQKILHQQQLAALKSTMTLQQQQHQITMQNLKVQGQLQVINAKTAGQLQVQNARNANRGSGGGGGQGGVAGGLGAALKGMGSVGGVLGTLSGGLIASEAFNRVQQLAQQMWESVKASDELARSYDRQALAGATLAGNQTKLNDLMVIYDKATGEALSKSRQMEGVVRLQAVGFADTKKELDQFSRAIRGISLAIGEPADFVTQNLILELFSQRGQRLDQLGLQYDDVRKRQEALMQSDRNLTKQQAYQEAVLQQALERYGDLSTSLQGQATGVERLEAAWDDLGLAMAQWVQNAASPTLTWLSKIVDEAAKAAEELSKVNPNTTKFPTSPNSIFQGGGVLSGDMDRSTAQTILNNALEQKARLVQDQIDIANGNSIRSAENVAADLATVETIIQGARQALSQISAQAILAGGGDSLPQGGPDVTMGSATKSTILTEEQEAALIEFADARQKIEEQTNQAILDENREYQSKRINIESDFNTKMAEDAADFARQRAKDQADFAKDLNKFMIESAKREINIKKDLNKSINRANRDFAKDQEKSERDHNKRIDDLKKDAGKDEAEIIKEVEKDQRKAREESAKKITEMEKEFGRDRARAAKEHSESILEAASRLDAKAIYFEQKKFLREEKEAEEEHARRIAKEKEALDEELAERDEGGQERISEIKENLAEQISEENEAHEIRVKDAQEAHAQQLADQKAAAAERLAEVISEDAERLKEMKNAHEERLKEEDLERSIRLDREQTHHNNQLLELDRVHADRIRQINLQAEDEKDELDKTHRARMLDLEYHNFAWEEAERRAKARALKEHEIFLKEDEKQRLDARQEELEDRLRDPALSSDEQQNIIDALRFLGDQISDINTEIDTAQDELERLPLPDYQPRSSAVVGSSGQSVTDAVASGVQLGLWKTSGASAANLPGTAMGAMMGGDVIFRIESGAIVVNAAPGQSPAAVGDEFEQRLLKVLQKVAKVKP